MKRFYCFTVAVLLSLTFIGCTEKYSESTFLGKTSSEITEEYGVFDCVTMPPVKDGLYKNCRCGYTIKDARAGFLGSTDEILFFIHFDDNGTAVQCTTEHRPGG